MKCAACGFEEKMQEEKVVQEAILFKPGPRKGKIKEVKESRIVIQEAEVFYSITSDNDLPITLKASRPKTSKGKDPVWSFFQRKG